MFYKTPHGIVKSMDFLISRNHGGYEKLPQRSGVYAWLFGTTSKGAFLIKCESLELLDPNKVYHKDDICVSWELKNELTTSEAVNELFKMNDIIKL